MSAQNTISIDTVIVRNNDLFMNEIDDELVCLDEISGNYYGLNNTGKIIWEMIGEPKSVKNIIAEMQKSYPDVPNIADDILSYLNELHSSNDKNRLITLS